MRPIYRFRFRCVLKIGWAQLFFLFEESGEVMGLLVLPDELFEFAYTVSAKCLGMADYDQVFR